MNANLYLGLDISVLSLIIINEIISFYSLKRYYFKDYMNYFDLASIILTILVLVLNGMDAKPV